MNGPLYRLEIQGLRLLNINYGKNESPLILKKTLVWRTSSDLKNIREIKDKLSRRIARNFYAIKMI